MLRMEGSTNGIALCELLLLGDIWGNFSYLTNTRVDLELNDGRPHSFYEGGFILEDRVRIGSRVHVVSRLVNRFAKLFFYDFFFFVTVFESVYKHIFYFFLGLGF